MSRDEQSCLVVSYREIKACVEAAFKFVPPPSRHSLSS
jgi:PAB-dependent poly(A)-specific ribonuclease subunit 3